MGLSTGPWPSLPPTPSGEQHSSQVSLLKRVSKPGTVSETEHPAIFSRENINDSAASPEGSGCATRGPRQLGASEPSPVSSLPSLSQHPSCPMAENKELEMMELQGEAAKP